MRTGSKQKKASKPDLISTRSKLELQEGESKPTLVAGGEETEGEEGGEENEKGDGECEPTFVAGDPPVVVVVVGAAGSPDPALLLWNADRNLVGAAAGAPVRSAVMEFVASDRRSLHSTLSLPPSLPPFLWFSSSCQLGKECVRTTRLNATAPTIATKFVLPTRHANSLQHQLGPTHVDEQPEK